MELTDAGFTWLRPLWLLALALLPLTWWLLRRHHGQQTVWQRAIDAHLLPHLLQHIEVRGGWRTSGLWLLAAVLAIVALAGPSWRQQAAPLWQKESPLVIALDLSAAMRATDLPPSRVVQARAKVKDLLQKRRSGQVGLLVYAGDAFTVAPITRDARTVIALLDSLSPDLMPVQGQRGDRAIEHALAMLRDSGASRGDILLISDRADAAAERAAAKARAAGVQVSVIGVGTLAGAPLTGSSGFITGADGQAVLARLDPPSLGALAAAGGGRYVPLAADDSDLVGLQVLDPAGSATSAVAGSIDSDAASVTRSDDGYWLLLLVLPLMLLGFRRGWLALLPLVIGLNIALPPTPAAAFGGPRACAAASGCALDAPAAPQARRPPTAGSAPGGPRACAAASESAAAPKPESGFSWDALWRRADQRAFAALQKGDNDRARALAPDPGLQGAAAYRGDDFEAAASAWAAQNDADAHYNRGNALARGGKLEDALRAYDEALARSPGMPDAVANRKAVEDALKQQQAQDSQKQQGQSGESGEKDQQKSDSQQSDQGDPQAGEGQSPDGKSGEQEQSRSGEEGESESAAENQEGQQDAGQSSSEAEQDGQPGSEDSASQPGEEQKPADADGDGKPDEPAGEASARPENSADAAAREAAEAAAKQAMQQALESAQEGKPEDAQQSVPMSAEQRAQAEQRQATEQLLRRVPDDPGALLRRKFELEYRRRLAEGDRQ